ncbi:endonuclease/exonuclease/phosphatase family protein [Paenibacillus marinisediminis]
MKQEVSSYQHELRCMSFNIKNAYDLEGPNVWVHRKEMVAGLIKFHRPDMVGLQEVLYQQLTDLEQALPEYGWVGVGREDGDKEGEFSCIFYRKKRLKPLEEGTFWLSEMPDTPGSMGWDAACTRVVTWARFHDVLNDQIFYHFNTHFDHVGVVAVEQSAHLILNRMNTLAAGHPVVLTGDFNVTSNSNTYQILCQQESASQTAEQPNVSLRDASLAAEYKHFGPTFTFQDFDSLAVAAHTYPMIQAAIESKRLEFESPIDFIFVSDSIQVDSYGIIADHNSGKMPSDHFPIIADIRL